MSDDLRIRFATPDDATTILDFIRGLAVFEREPVDRVRAAPEDLVRDGFGDHPLFEILLVERRDGATLRPIGFALFFPHYSTWEGRPGLYVEDLFIVESERRRGAGRALLAALARIAHERGWSRIDLSVLDWNPARSFYEAHGMVHQAEWLSYRMEAEGIARLAAEAPRVE